MLKPCPFCGGTEEDGVVEFLDYTGGYGNKGVVECLECGFEYPSPDWVILPREAAEKRWNKWAERHRPAERNIDVGTPQDQRRRWRNWCESQFCEFRTPCTVCFAKWLKQPYRDPKAARPEAAPYHADGRAGRPQPADTEGGAK